MELSPNQIESLKRMTGRALEAFEENGCRYIFIQSLPMPSGCLPEQVDALFCMSPRDGYPSRLFLAEQVQIPGNPDRNWNAKDVRINGRNWFAISWTVQVSQEESLVNLVSMHLKAFQ